MPTLETLAGIVAHEFGITVEELKNHSRDHKYCKPRQVFCWLALQLDHDMEVRTVSEFVQKHTKAVYHANETIASYGFIKNNIGKRALKLKKEIMKQEAINFNTRWLRAC